MRISPQKVRISANSWIKKYELVRIRELKKYDFVRIRELKKGMRISALKKVRISAQ